MIREQSDQLFEEAIAQWYLADDTEALKTLNEIKTPHAINLARLIEKSHITVLTQLPWITKGTQDIFSGAEFDSKFIVRNIGFKPQDIQNRPYANIHEFYDPTSPPDFYVTQMVEGHLIAPNIQELPCPVFGQTSDYDLNIQCLYPWLRLFDELIVNGPEEKEEVSKLSEVSVTMYPKTFSLPDSLPPLPTVVRREIDFFMSGTVHHPYHFDKSRLVNQILDIPDFNPLFYNGFLEEDPNYELLSNAKMALTFTRHADAMPTRGLEALAMGCALIVRKQSVLTSFLGEEEGVVTYDYAKDDLPEVMMRVKREWPLFEQRALRGAEIVRREFNSARVASQYLRFLTVLAARPRPERRIAMSANLDQKRPVIFKGWGYPYDTYKKMQQVTAQRVIDRISVTPDAASINDVAREYLLEFSSWACLSIAQNNQGNHVFCDYTMLSHCLEMYRMGIGRFPRSLVLRFNMIRAALHFGSPGEVDEALDLLQDTLTIPESQWLVTPLDDVMPWDFFSQMFNYRSYLDTVTDGLKVKTVSSSRLINLIRAALYNYWGHYSGSAEHLESAVKLDPDFPYYQLRLAATLVKSSTTGDCRRAMEILGSVAEKSMLFIEAFQLLEEHESIVCSGTPQTDTFRKRYQRICTSFHAHTYHIENWGDPHLQMSDRSKTRPLSVFQIGKRLNVPARQATTERPLRILLITLEFTDWSGGRGWTYPSNLGIEEGFAAQGVEFFTIPMNYGISSQLPASWLFHIKKLCFGREFDQVWIELVHGDPGEEILEWLGSVAPVRVGLLPESLSYDYEDYILHPNLFKRRLEVESRLRYMTHAVVVDEKDADDLNHRGIVKALWRPETVPSWSVANQPNTCRRDKAVFYGTLYGARKRWMKHPSLKGLCELRPSAEAGTTIPHAFTSVGNAALTTLNSGRQINGEFLTAYLDSLRSIRRLAFANWITLAGRAPMMVNLPSITKAQSGRVVEAMAAGCPMLTWELPDRPKSNALFRDGEELLFFRKDNPESLAEQIRYLQKNPEKARAIAGRALETVRTRHTVERRVGQILEWIKSGEEPDYMKSSGVSPSRHFSLPTEEQLSGTVSRFMQMAGYDGYSPRVAPESEAVATVADTNNRLAKFGSLIEQRDIDAARRLLEDAYQKEPKLASNLAQFYFVTGDIRKAEELLLQTVSAKLHNDDVYGKLSRIAHMEGNLEISRIYAKIGLALGPPAGEIMNLIETITPLSSEGRT